MFRYALHPLLQAQSEKKSCVACSLSSGPANHLFIFFVLESIDISSSSAAAAEQKQPQPRSAIDIYIFSFLKFMCVRITFRSVLDKQRPEWDVDFQSNCQVTSLIVGIAAMAQSRIQSIQSAERTLLDRLFLHGGGCIQHRAEPSTWLSYISNVDFRCFSFSKKKKTRHKEIRTGSRPFLLLAWIIAIY